jgi:large subunit ribosomal protein L17
MRHRHDHRQLSRNTAHRKAMLRNLVTSLIDHESIRTTDAKAKEVRRIAEKMITLGKRGDLAARRNALRTVRSRDAAAKLFGPLAERFRERPGGYTRIIKIGRRPGDNAAISLIQLIPDAGSGQTTTA